MVDVGPLAAACGGAPGVTKPGVDRLIYVGSAAIEGMLAAVTDGAGAVALSAILGGITYDATHVCSNGDPGDPGMSADDWARCLDYFDPFAMLAAQTKARQWLLHQLWPLMCNCSDGTSPPTPVANPLPHGTGNPGLPTGPVGPNCWDTEISRTVNYANQFAWDFTDTLPNNPSPNGDGQFNHRIIQTPTPTGLIVKLSSTGGGTKDYPVDGFVNFFTASGAHLSTVSLAQLAPGATLTSALIPIPATAAEWFATVTPVGGNTGTPTNSVTWESIIYCAGQSPTGVDVPCCPPDPSVDQRLSLILELLNQLLSLQPLQGPYQDATRHSALSGNGTISINPASSAIRVEVRSDLTNWPHNVQTPTYYYSLGFVTPFAVGTPLRGQRLIYDRQTFTWPSYTDVIGYALEPGVIVDLVELTRGA